MWSHTWWRGHPSLTGTHCVARPARLTRLFDEDKTLPHLAIPHVLNVLQILADRLDLLDVFRGALEENGGDLHKVLRHLGKGEVQRLFLVELFRQVG